MKTKKRIFSFIMSLLIITSNILPVAMIQATDNISSTKTNEEISSEVNLLTETNVNTVSEENSEPGETTDNWQLDVVFYDSTVNNGTTPLTSINWDASDGGYDEGESRVVTVQINYKNTNVLNTYAVGALEIKIPNLVYSLDSTYSSLKWSVMIGANDSTHSGYDWNFVGKTAYNTYTSLNSTIPNIIFTNAKEITAGVNCEGSIQMVFTFTPKSDVPEAFDDECVYNYNKNLYAEITDVAQSNTISFNYTRTYTHVWQKKTPVIQKTASKLNSYDNLGSNAGDYIWVKYNMKVTNLVDESPTATLAYTNYPYWQVYYKNAIVRDSIPDECIVYDTSGNLLSKENGTYNLTPNISGLCSMYVGYPKSIYNEENGNLTITNTAHIYGIYDIGEEEQYFGESSVTINLAEFEFEYTGELYGISKIKDRFASSIKYQDIKDIYTSTPWQIYPTAIYTGSPMTVKIGDDLLYYTNVNGEYSKINDNNYYFSSIQFVYWKNANGDDIVDGKYNCELWVRYAGNTEYTLYQEFLNGYGGKNQYNSDGFWTFATSEKIVGWYIIIHDMTESLSSASQINTYAMVKFNNIEIPQDGNIYNFSYIQTYLKDQEGNLILQNEPNIDSYASMITKEEIATFDKNTYGTYMQRDFDSINWKYFKITQPRVYLESYKTIGSVIQNEEKKQFTGTCTIGTKMHATNPLSNVKLYIEQLDPVNAFRGFYVYDLLPEGMELTSNEDDILNSVAFETYRASSFYDLNGKLIDEEAQFRKMVKENTNIIITNNWNNTGRTKIEIIVDLSDNPLYFHGTKSNLNSEYSYSYRITWKYKYTISYDSILEYGSTYSNYCYVNKNEKSDNKLYQTVKDNGQYDSSAADINENQNTTELLAYDNKTVSITSIISTHQDVQIKVKTDLNNYSIGAVKTTPESEYSYKLRARTGTNQVTNLVLINNIEEAYGSNPNYWKGEFLGIDTSFAENRVYNVYDPGNKNADASGYVKEKIIVKTYYSKNKNEGNLYETELQTVTDDKGNIVYNEDGSELKMEVRITDSNGNFVKNTNWLEYDDTVDKSTVESLAFEFLNAETGEPAILPANELVYVEVNMKAPTESEGINDQAVKYAYNSCFTQWNAIDEFAQSVDFITGINSNIVSVSFPIPEKDIVISKIWQFNQDYIKINIKNALGFAADFDYIEILNADETTALETIENTTDNGLIVSENKYDIDKSYVVKVYMKDGTTHTTIVNENKFNIVPIFCELLINGSSQETFELNNDNNWTYTLTVPSVGTYEVIEKTTGNWTYEVSSTDNDYVITNTVNHKIEIANIIVPAPEEIIDTGNENILVYIYVMFMLGSGILISTLLFFNKNR